MVDYAVFEAYEKLKSKRGERDLADRCATPHGLLPPAPVTYVFQTPGLIGYLTS